MDETQNTQNIQPVQKKDINLMALISYFGILCLVPLFLKKDGDDFALFHAKQGSLVFLGEVFTYILFSWNNFAPFSAILNLGWAIMSIIGIINVVKNEKKVLPLIGEYADRIKI